MEPQSPCGSSPRCSAAGMDRGCLRTGTGEALRSGYWIVRTPSPVPFGSSVCLQARPPSFRGCVRAQVPAGRGRARPAGHVPPVRGVDGAGVRRGQRSLPQVPPPGLPARLAPVAPGAPPRPGCVRLHGGVTAKTPRSMHALLLDGRIHPCPLGHILIFVSTLESTTCSGVVAVCMGDLHGVSRVLSEPAHARKGTAAL